MKLSLIADWRFVLKYAWSIRFNIAAAIFSALEFVVPLIQPGEIPRGVFAAIAFCVSIAATCARVLAQKEIPHAIPDSDQVTK